MTAPDAAPAPTSRLPAAAWSLFFLFGVGLAIAAVYLAQARTDETPELVGPTTGNGTFSLAEQKGHVVVLDFFQVICESCLIVEDRLQALAPEWSAASVEVVSVGIHPDNDLETLRDYQQKNGINWTVVRDVTGRAAREFGVIAIPTLVVVDAHGDVVYREAGLPSEAELRAIVAAAVAEDAPAIPLPQYSLAGLAVLAAVAAFFSPCAVGLLPGYVAHTLRFAGPTGRSPLAHALVLGSTAAAGLLLVFLGVGALAFAFGRVLAPYLAGLAPFVGLVLVLVGVLLLVRPYSLWLQRFFRPLTVFPGDAAHVAERTLRTHFLYGVGYGAGAAGCTAPVLLNLVVVAATAQGVWTGAWVVLLYGLVAAALLVAVTLVVATGQDAASSWIRRHAIHVERVSAVLFLFAGVFVVAFAWRAGTISF